MKPAMDKAKRIPFYEQCAGHVLDGIRSGRYAVGEFLPSERELSKSLGVNRLTLRKGLGALVRRGVLESVPGAGNRVVGRGRGEAKARLIACVMNRQPGVRTLSPYYADVFGGIEAALSDSGYNAVFVSVRSGDLWTASGTERVNPRAVNAACAGALLIGGLPDELARLYRKRGAAVAVVDRAAADDLPSFVPDNENGACEIAQYLVRLGHRRIAFLGAADDPVVRARLAGLKRGMREAGCAFDERDFVRGDYEVRPAAAAMKAYLASRAGRLPTAVLAVNDEAAIGAMKAIHEAGLSVPGDISVAGFDDIAWSAHAVPPLTTVRIPREEMGRLAARAVLDELAGARAGSGAMLLETGLIVRESCGAPGGGPAGRKKGLPRR